MCGCSCMSPTGDLARNSGMRPDQESNQWPLGSQSALNPLSHTSQDPMFLRGAGPQCWRNPARVSFCTHASISVRSRPRHKIANSKSKFATYCQMSSMPVLASLHSSWKRMRMALLLSVPEPQTPLSSTQWGHQAQDLRQGQTSYSVAQESTDISCRSRGRAPGALPDLVWDEHALRQCRHKNAGFRSPLCGWWAGSLGQMTLLGFIFCHF